MSVFPCSYKRHDIICPLSVPHFCSIFPRTQDTSFRAPTNFRFCFSNCNLLLFVLFTDYDENKRLLISVYPSVLSVSLFFSLRFLILFERPFPSHTNWKLYYTLRYDNSIVICIISSPDFYEEILFPEMLGLWVSLNPAKANT